MTVAIIKYNSGNIGSLAYALNRLGIDPLVTDNPTQIMRADKVIFPGQGQAATAMNYLRQRKLDQVIKDLKQPFLGICLGLQLLFDFSEENDTSGLGIIPGKVTKFQNLNPRVNSTQALTIPANLDYISPVIQLAVKQKIPQIGWNSVSNLQGELFQNISPDSMFYFIHSYFAPLGNFTTSKTSHINEFSSSVKQNNFYGVQFHPEKSGLLGSQIIANFLDI
jgi:imidazole glycerol-phosphate synthase subunit HisH